MLYYKRKRHFLRLFVGGQHIQSNVKTQKRLSHFYKKLGINNHLKKKRMTIKKFNY